MNNKVIAYVRIQIDDQVPEYMTGIIRCTSVISEDENGDVLTDHQDLFDNTEFDSERELIEYVAFKLGVSADIVEISR